MIYSRRFKKIAQKKRKWSRHWKNKMGYHRKKIEWYTWKEESMFQITERSGRKS